MNRLLSITLCFGLLLPILETLIAEIGVLDNCVLTSFSCEENEETEKEEEVESKENYLLHHNNVLVSISRMGFLQSENHTSILSVMREVVSPPPKA